MSYQSSKSKRTSSSATSQQSQISIIRFNQTCKASILASAKFIMPCFMVPNLTVLPVCPWSTASNCGPGPWVCSFVLCVKTNTIDPQATVSDGITPFTSSRHAERRHGHIDTLCSSTTRCLSIQGHGAIRLGSETQVCMLIQSCPVSIGEEAHPLL